MSNYVNFVLLLWFFGAAGILSLAALRLYNIMSVGEIYGWGGSFMGLAGTLLSGGLVLFANMMSLDITVSVFSSLFLLLGTLSLMLWVAEVMLLTATTATKITGPRSRFQPMERRNGRV